MRNMLISLQKIEIKAIEEGVFGQRYSLTA